MIDAHVEFPDGEESLTFLEDALEFSGVTGVILVQRTAQESMNLSCLKLTEESDGLVYGLVSSALIDDLRGLRVQLDTDSRKPLVLGYNVDIHAVDAGAWVRNEDVHYGTALIAEHSKPMDILCRPDQVFELLPFLDSHPGMAILLDHCLDETPPDDHAWRRVLREIGRRPHVHYRLSGLAPVAEADSAYEATERVKRSFEAALNAFGPARLVYGSGWPVTPARYPVWLNTVDNLIHSLSANERADIYGCNAEKIYQLSK